MTRNIRLVSSAKATEVSGQLRQSQLVKNQAVQRRWLAAAAAVSIGAVLVRRRRKT